MPRGLAAVAEVRTDRRASNGAPIGLWRLQCEGTSRQTGKRCGAWAVPGLYVCRWHGGSTKAAQAAGRRRMAEMSRVGVDSLVRLCSHDDPAVQLKAATALLDRCGGTLEEICGGLDADENVRRGRRAKRGSGGGGSPRSQSIAS